MAFYNPDPAMAQILADLVRPWRSTAAGLSDRLALTSRYGRGFVADPRSLPMQSQWADPAHP
jgi:hypothetical protein